VQISKKIFFVSKDANWQLYRNEIFTKLAHTFNFEIQILTTGDLNSHLLENERLQYKIFKNKFAAQKKISLFPGAIKYIIKNKPDVVIGLDNTTQLTEYLTFIMCKLYKIKYIWWTHGYDHLPLKNKFLRVAREKYKLFFLRKADVIITFSEYGKEFLVERRVKKENIFVAPNTLDTDKLTYLHNKVQNTFNKIDFVKSHFKKLNENDRNIILLFSGRLNKNKKVENALLALKQLVDSNIHAYLYILGDGEEKFNLQALAKELQIDDHVNFAGPVYEDEESSKYFLSGDVFIMPGYVGLAIVHAFAFGLPILTEDVKTHSPEIQYLHHGYNGYFIKENNIEKMADAIKKLYLDENLLQELKSGARQTILQEANIHTMLNGMNQAIQSVINK
jgi:glycosyltransferase involved in cell wall biosynthesis